MLTTYRRHRKDCEHRGEGRKYRRCHCPIWVDGFIGSQEIRKSLNTADWQKAQDLVREWEAEGQQLGSTEPVTIKQAWEKYVADARARKLTESSVYKYELLSREMENFAERAGYRFLSELTADALSSFRTGWKDGALSGLKNSNGCELSSASLSGANGSRITQPWS